MLANILLLVNFKNKTETFDILTSKKVAKLVF